MMREMPGGTLYDYQVAALERIAKFQGRALIADEMGLGKTPNALAWLYANPHLRPALVICPASIKLQWAREASAWLGIPLDEIQVMKGTKSSPATEDIVICNYDILSKRLTDLHQHQFRAVILDESHYVKESGTKRSKMAKLLCDQPCVQSVLALTGTPVLNRPKTLAPVTASIPHLAVVLPICLSVLRPPACGHDLEHREKDSQPGVGLQRRQQSGCTGRYPARKADDPQAESRRDGRIAPPSRPSRCHLRSI